MAGDVARPSLHIEPEALGVYLEGGGTARERADVEAHLAICAECYELFVDCARDLAPAGPEVRPALAAAAEAPTAAPASRTAWWLGGLAAAAILVVGTSWLLLGRRAGPDPRASAEYADLVAILRDDRLVEGRLSGRVPYGPPPETVRGADPPPADLRVQAAAARVQQALSTDSRPDARAAVGVSHLLAGQSSAGVAELERAVAADPADAATQNDLAVAYLERARATGAASDLEKALTAADRAAALDPRMTEAVFNHALALERLGRREDAASRWKAYLALDATSEWAKEASRRLAELSR